MASIYDKVKCPLCDAIPIYAYHDGVSVCKCPTKGCHGNAMWKTEDGWLSFRERMIYEKSKGLR